MSIKTHGPLEGSIHLMDTLNFSEKRSNDAPNAHDMTIEVISLNSPPTNLLPLFKNGKNLPNLSQSCHPKNTDGQNSATLHTKEPHIFYDCTSSPGTLTNLLSRTTAAGLFFNSQCLHWGPTCDPNSARSPLLKQCGEEKNRPLNPSTGQPIVDANPLAGTSIYGLCTPSHSGSQPPPIPNISEPTFLPNSSFQCLPSGLLFHSL